MVESAVSTSITAVCRACGGSLDCFMSLGSQPVAQISPERPTEQTQIRYELRPSICLHCGLFQLIETPLPYIMFTNTYPYFSSTSAKMTYHLQKLSESVASELDVAGDPFVVEVGSNDGTFLKLIAEHGLRHLGVEPAEGAANIARSMGVSVLVTFFDSSTALQIRQSHGQADVIVGANVLAHMPSIIDVAKGIADLLKDDGLFVFEAIYLPDLLRCNMFDQLYGEHVFTFSVSSVRKVFAKCALELIDVCHVDVQGGSMRYVLAHRGRKNVAESVSHFIDFESRFGLGRADTYHMFAERCHKIRNDLRFLLGDLRKRQYRVVGYGASAKSTTLFNWCELDSSIVEYVTDCTKEKQGHYIPGTSIPVRSPEFFAQDRPDYALLSAWNHRTEIEAKEQHFRRRGGKWIVYVPEVATA